MISQKRPRRDNSPSRGRIRRSPAGKRNKLARTVILATLAAAFAVFWLARELELDRDELLGYLVTSLLFVAILIGFSVVGGVALLLIRRLIRSVIKRLTRWRIKADR